MWREPTAGESAGTLKEGGMEKKKRQQVSKKERKNKGYKEAKKETKSYHSVDFLFLDFWAVSYLRVDICGVSKLTGMPVGFLLCTSAESIWQL